jgi:hypothetical protein
MRNSFTCKSNTFEGSGGHTGHWWSLSCRSKLIWICPHQLLGKRRSRTRALATVINRLPRMKRWWTTGIFSHCQEGWNCCFYLGPLSWCEDCNHLDIPDQLTSWGFENTRTEDTLPKAEAADSTCCNK